MTSRRDFLGFLAAAPVAARQAATVAADHLTSGSLGPALKGSMMDVAAGVSLPRPPLDEPYWWGRYVSMLPQFPGLTPEDYRAARNAEKAMHMAAMAGALVTDPCEGIKSFSPSYKAAKRRDALAKTIGSMLALNVALGD